MTEQRGFALLIVLWTMVLLALLMSQVMASSRIAVDLAGNLRVAAQERAADDGAIQAAVFHLAAKGAAHWPADGASRSVAIGGAPITLRARSLSGMVNPNLAPAALLAGLLQAVSVPAFQATAIATAIVAWRTPPASPTARAAASRAYRSAGRAFGPPGAPFQSLAQLTNVLGMTPAISARLAPYLSLFQQGNPDPKFAAPAVRAALAQATAAGPKFSAIKGAQVVDITACAPPGLCRHAVVSLTSVSGTPFRLLALN